MFKHVPIISYPTNINKSDGSRKIPMGPSSAPQEPCRRSSRHQRVRSRRPERRPRSVAVTPWSPVVPGGPRWGRTSTVADVREKYGKIYDKKMDGDGKKTFESEWSEWVSRCFNQQRNLVMSRDDASKSHPTEIHVSELRMVVGHVSSWGRIQLKMVMINLQFGLLCSSCWVCRMTWLSACL